MIAERPLTTPDRTPLVIDQFLGPDYAFYCGDTVEAIRGVPDNAMGLWIQSVPFPGMYVYSNTPRDMGNCHDIGEFGEQFRFLSGEMLRTTMPGRNCWIHISQMLAFKSRDEFVGLHPFRELTINVMRESGWAYYGECVIGKDPQYKAIRSKDDTLLFKTLATDGARLRPALNDYMLIFHKQGENPVPVRAGVSEKYGNPYGWVTSEQWISWASGIWPCRSEEHPDGIAECDVLQVREARNEDDQRHLCPLQLEAIRRPILLQTNPGEIVATAFGGVASELYTALKLGRKAWGCELKPDYWRQGCKNIRRVIADRGQITMNGLFSDDDSTGAL